MSWGGGYVTDIAYAPGYYAEQSPRLGAIAALVGGCTMPVPARNEPYHFVDIGCGRGYTALVLAAANPGWTVTGLDFHPGHVAGARALAARAGLANIRFVEADLTDFDAASLDDFDAASLHGVWTWVGEPVRAGVLRLLAAKLKPGGLCHVSYNVLPGWGGMVALQRLMREAGSRLAFRADRQAERGFAVVRRLIEAQGEAADPMARRIVEACADKPAAYLAHEFMNEAWAPCFHADVAARFAEAKLAYAASPRLVENFPALTLSEAARGIVGEFEDTAMFELMKDLVAGQPLRHDVYVRGAVRHDALGRDRALRGLVLGPAVPHARRQLEFNTPGGKATMNAAIYEPVLGRLAEGPASVETLLDVVRRDGARMDDPAELVAMLLGTGQAVPVAEPGAAMDRATVALNAAMFAEKMQGGSVMQPIALAVPALGGGFALPGIGAFAVLRRHDWLNEATIGQTMPAADEADFARWATLAAPDAEPEIHAKLVGGFREFLADQAAMLNALGLVC